MKYEGLVTCLLSFSIQVRLGRYPQAFGWIRSNCKFVKRRKNRNWGICRVFKVTCFRCLETTFCTLWQGMLKSNLEHANIFTLPVPSEHRSIWQAWGKLVRSMLEAARQSPWFNCMILFFPLKSCTVVVVILMMVIMM